MEYRAVCSDDHKALAHYGHKGMRWGHRQWQNPDGSLTDAGRIHYGIGEARTKTKEKYNKAKTTIKNEISKTSKSVATSEITKAVTKTIKNNLPKAKSLVAKNASLAYSAIATTSVKTGKAAVGMIMSNPEIAGSIGFALFTAGMVGLGIYGAYKSTKQINALATSQKRYYDERIHPNGSKDSISSLKSLADEIKYNSRNSATDESYAKYRKTLGILDRIESDSYRRANKRYDAKNAARLKSGIAQLKRSGKTISEIADSLGMKESEVEYYLYGGGSLKHSLYLAHHGTKGMHWGDRRWQNLDGSLTPAGYIHYGYKGPRNVSKRTQGKIERLKKKQADADAAMTKAASRYDSAHSRAKKATNKSKYGVSVFRNPQRDYEKAVKERDKASEGYYRARSQKEKAQASLDSIAKRERFKQDTVWTAKKIAGTAGLIAESTSDKINDAISNRNTNKLLKASKELRTSEPEEKAEFLNSLSKINSKTARVQPAIYDVLLSSVGQISRVLNVTPFTIKTQFDFDYTGPLDDKKYIMFGRDDMKKAFPGLNDKAGEQASTYVFDAYVKRTNKMQVEANDDGSLWTISERSKKTANDKRAYINASREGFTTHVELTKDRRFTIESLDTLGFTNQEIADKLGLSIGQVGEVLYGYEAWTG